MTGSNNYDHMMKVLLILCLMCSLLVTLCLCSCGRKTIPIQSQQIDSVRVEHRTEYVERVRIDTVMIEVPAQSVQRETRDSSSHLETDFAVSDARIRPDGSLYHNLHNKPQKRPKTVTVTDTEQIIVRDSIVYRDKSVEIPVKMPLTRWEQVRIWIGTVVLCLIGGAVICYVLRLIFKR